MVEHRFILKHSENLLNRPHTFGFGLFGLVTFYRTYSRPKSDRLISADEVYPQMPFEKITKEDFEKFSKQMKKVELTNLSGHIAYRGLGCGSQSCQIS